MLKCIQDDFNFFIQNFNFRAILNFSILEEKDVGEDNNTSIIYFLNFLNAQKTLNAFFNHLNQHEQTISSAIQCNQIDFLKKVDDSDIALEHFYLAFNLRNLNIIKLLKSKNKVIYDEFLNQIKPNKYTFFQSLFSPFYSKGSKELLDFFFNNKKELIWGSPIQEVANLFATADVAFAQQVLPYVNCDSLEYKLELIRAAYLGGNLLLASFLENKFGIKFEAFFDDLLKNTTRDQISNLLGFLCKAREEQKFDIALKILSKNIIATEATESGMSLDKFEPFYDVLLYVMEYQQFSYLQKIIDSFKVNSKINWKVYLYLLSIAPNIRFEQTFFDSLSHILEQKLFGFSQKDEDQIQEIYDLMFLAYFKTDSLGISKNKPTFILALLYFLHQHGCSHFVESDKNQSIESSKFATVVNRTLIQFGSNTNLASANLKTDKTFQELFDAIYDGISKIDTTNIPLLTQEELDVFFARLVQEGLVVWSPAFTSFAFQPQLTLACIQKNLDSIRLGEKRNKFDELINALATQVKNNEQVFVKMFSNLDLNQAIKLLLSFINTSKSEDEYQLFRLICSALNQSFFADKSHRNLILSNLDQHLAKILSVQYVKNSDPEKTRLIVDKTNYLLSCLLEHSNKIDLPKTSNFLRQENHFRKVLAFNNIQLVFSKKDLEKHPVKLKLHADPSVVTTEQQVDVSDNNNNNNADDFGTRKVLHFLSGGSFKVNRNSSSLVDVPLSPTQQSPETTPRKNSQIGLSKYINFPWNCCKGSETLSSKDENDDDNNNNHDNERQSLTSKQL